MRRGNAGQSRCPPHERVKNSNEGYVNERTPLNYPTLTIFWPPASAITGLGDYMRASERDEPPYPYNQPAPTFASVGERALRSLSLGNASRSLRLFAAIDRAGIRRKVPAPGSKPPLWVGRKKKVSLPNGRAKWKIIPTIPFHASSDWK